MSLDLSPFCIAPGHPADLQSRPTRIAPMYADKADYRKVLGRAVDHIGERQRALYAERRSALLVILQAMDAAGKDGVIRHVFSGVNPQGCRVDNFEPPSRAELSHDFLWRTALRLPPHGYIGVFNRSYYEEVLVVRVNPDLLAGEGVRAEGERLWRGRFQSILDHEAHLARSGVRVLKIFLHLSKAEQRRRFLRRIARPDKHWKLDPSDIGERSRWRDYQKAYEACLSATSAQGAPWLVVPADDKKSARLLVAQAVSDALDALDPRYPPTSPKLQARLDEARRRLEAEED